MSDSHGPVSDVPQQLGPYRMVRRVGSGAMGDIFLGEDTREGRRVAIKTPTLETSDRELLLRRFRREARAAEGIRHAHVCRVFESNADSAPPYYVMEWIDGMTLRQWLDERALVAVAHAVELAIQLADGLQAAHDLGILHRDLKPENVMMRSDHDPVIVDFGLARWFDRVHQSLLTVEGSIVGSPAYMAPEQILADSPSIGPPADVYSLGVLLYEMLTGNPPFVGEGIAVMFKAAHDIPAPASQFRRDVPPALDAIIGQALAKQPEERFATMTAFRTALECYSRGEPMSWAESNGRQSTTSAAQAPCAPDARGLRGLFKRLWR